MDNITAEDEIYFNRSISAVVRIESVDYFEHPNDSVQVEVYCLTQDFGGNNINIRLHSTINPSELKDTKMNYKEGAVYYVKDDYYEWDEEEIVFFSPKLLPYEGNKESFNKSLDDQLSSMKQQEESSEETKEDREVNVLDNVKALREVDHREYVAFSGKVKEIKLLKTRKGDEMAFLVVEDASGEVEVVVFPDPYNRYEVILCDYDEQLFFGGVADVGDDETKILLEDIVPPWSPMFNELETERAGRVL